jgi:hypothetical protein
MTLALAIIAALGWLVAAWLWWTRRAAYRWNDRQAIAWFFYRVEIERENKRLRAEVRELINKPRRNTGKAEL